MQREISHFSYVLPLIASDMVSDNALGVCLPNVGI